MAMIREKSATSWPTLLRLYRADKFLVNKHRGVGDRVLRGSPHRSPSIRFAAEFDRMVAVVSSTARQRSETMPGASTA